jgi:5-methylthioadenosine/S-adenosylhomocysteine deaminase
MALILAPEQVKNGARNRRRGMDGTLFTNAVLWSGAETDGEGARQSLLVTDGRIAAIGPELPAQPGVRVIDAAGALLLPGLVNAHFHSPVNHMKGRLPSLPLEIFMLYESPNLEVLHPTPEEAYVRTALAAIEMLRTGTTAVQDDAFFVPGPTPEIIDAVMQAYADCGIRARVALDQSDLPEIGKLPFLDQHASAEVREALSRLPHYRADALLDAYEHLVTRWHGAENGRLQAAVSCSAPQRVSPGYARALRDLSDRLGLPLYVHILETRVQRHLGMENFGGRSLVGLADQLDLLSPLSNVIHAIWVDDADLRLMAERGVTVAHNPISNLRLGSGVMSFRALRDHDIPIALGTDEAIADDAVNMWAVMKMAGLIHNIGQPDYERWPQAGEILDCLWTGGHRAMASEPGAGQIAVGAKADLVLLDIESLAFTPLNHLARQMIYCENGSSVRLTMVDGAVVFAEGRVLGVDETALLTKARELARRQRPGLQEAEIAAEKLLPTYRGLYLEAAERDVGMNRWVGR